MAYLDDLCGPAADPDDDQLVRGRKATHNTPWTLPHYKIHQAGPRLDGMDAARKKEIEERVYAGDRITGRDSEELAACDDLAWLGRLANDRRAAHHGDRVTFLIGDGQIPDSPTVPAEPVPAPAEVLRRFAVARLEIIGPRHVTCSTAQHTTALAQLALNFGVDDLVAPAGADRDEILHLIWDAGFRPVERDEQDNTVREYDPPVPLAERRATPQQVWA